MHEQGKAILTDLIALLSESGLSDTELSRARGQHAIPRVLQEVERLSANIRNDLETLFEAADDIGLNVALVEMSLDSLASVQTFDLGDGRAAVDLGADGVARSAREGIGQVEELLARLLGR